jgi:hypothetical protein
MDVMETLVEIIQNSVGGCARHWAEVIADGLIAHGVTVQKWISVTERLPTFDDLPDYAGYDYHLVCCKNFITGKCTVRPALASYDGFADKFLISCHGATHWMPLPEPPKGE